jgi:hypothetical protein
MSIAEQQGYLDGCEIPDHGEVAIYPLMFTFAIVSDLSEWGYGDRWCYSTYNAARNALEEWKRHPEWLEPEGWHRHPKSGRRRENGDPSTETINF